ncbi:MAG: phage tail protein [Massilia sp.]
MNAPLIKTYHLASAAQWQGGVLAGALRAADGALQPFAPYAQPGRALGPASGADMGALGADGSAWWRGTGRILYRLASDGAVPEQLDAPSTIARSTTRLVAGCRVLWAASHDGSRLDCLAQDDLCTIMSIKLPAGLVDLADAGNDGVWVLLGEHILHARCGGSIVRTLPLPRALPRMRAIAYLRDEQRLALLTEDGAAVWFIDPAGAAPPRELRLAAVAQDMLASRLATDGRALLFAAGTDKLIVFDTAGDLLDTIALRAAPAAIAARGTRLLVADARGATLFDNAGATTTDAACELITPMLHSPRRGDGAGWLRAELSLRLPRGATLTADYAESDDAEVRKAAQRIARDPALTPRQRFEQLSALLGTWSAPVSFTGTGDAAVELAAPLFDARAEHLWLRLRLSAPAGAAMPRLNVLRVLYPDRSLMQSLPAIYRNEQRQDFLRALVGVLETSTQGIDRRIATLGRLIDPATANAEWLDYTARWLGMPWDDGLSLDQKRALMKAAPDILATRGTRHALEAMLACLFPRQPRVFLVRDSSDLAPLWVGAATLPALLGGLPSGAAVLHRKTILGHARLPDPAAPGAGVAPPARITVEITATRKERAQASEWLPALIDALVPVTARALLRWREAALAGSGTTVGVNLVLDELPDARLGENATINAARLPGRRIMRLTDAGLAAGFPLL